MNQLVNKSQSCFTLLFNYLDGEKRYFKSQGTQISQQISLQAPSCADLSKRQKYWVSILSSGPRTWDRSVETGKYERIQGGGGVGNFG